MGEERKKLLNVIRRRQNFVSAKFHRKSLAFRINVQKSVRRSITGDANRSLRRYIQEPPQIKFIDKMSFSVSVLILLLSEFLMLSYPSFFKWFYVCMLFPLMLVRYVDYRDKKYHFFMFDLCYFVNFLSVAHICFFPNSTWLFETIFVLANGPVLFAIIVWRNSMVLHSVDKMTSLFIHAFPPFYCFTHRWLDTSRVRIASTILSTHSWLLSPTLMYVMWQFTYLLKTEVVSRSYLEQNVDVETSLRWLARDSKNFTNKLAKKVCTRIGVMDQKEKFDSTSLKTKFIFVAFNFFYFAICILPTTSLFSYKYVHLAVLLFAMFCSVWQGANYYIEVFSERYSSSLEQKAKQLQEQYLFIDENLDSLMEDKWAEIQSDVSDLDTNEFEYDTSDEYTDGDGDGGYTPSARDERDSSQRQFVDDNEY